MRDLLEAICIFLKYADPSNPICCEHDVMTICGVDPKKVSDEDTKRLDELGFFVSDECGESSCFQSYRFGSA